MEGELLPGTVALLPDSGQHHSQLFLTSDILCCLWEGMKYTELFLAGEFVFSLWRFEFCFYLILFYTCIPTYEAILYLPTYTILK